MIKNLFKDMTGYLPAQIVPGLMGFISIPILTRLFPPVEYGYYILAVAFASMLATFSGWLSMSIIRFFPTFEQRDLLGVFYRQVFNLYLVMVLILTLSSAGLLFAFGQGLNETLNSLLWVAIIFFVFTSCFGLLKHFLRARRLVGAFSGFTIWQNVSKLAIGLLLVMLLNRGAEGILWGGIIGMIVALPWLFRKAKGAIRFSGPHFSRETTRNLAWYGVPLALSNLASWLLSFSDRYFLEFFRTGEEVGLYSASYGVAEHSIKLIVLLFMTAAGPIAYRIWERDGPNESSRFISSLTRVYIIICFPAVVGISLLSKPLIAFLVDDQYLMGYRIVPWIAVSGFFLGIHHRYQSGLAFHRRTGFITIAVFSSALFNMGLNYLFIPSYGYMAAAITTLASYGLLVLMTSIASRRLFVWKFPFFTLLKTVMASAVMGVVIFPIAHHLTGYSAVNIGIAVLVAVPVYFLILYLMREFKDEEIRSAVLLITRRSGRRQS